MEVGREGGGGVWEGGREGGREGEEREESVCERERKGAHHTGTPVRHASFLREGIS